MLTVRIKNRATIGKLQGPYEASIKNRTTWIIYAKYLDRIVAFLGPDKSPDDVFKQDIEHCRAYLIDHYGYTPERARQAIAAASSFWGWMLDMGLATANPCTRPILHHAYKEAKQKIEVIIE